MYALNIARRLTRSWTHGKGHLCGNGGAHPKAAQAKGWRQIDLAEHSGVHEVHISDLERGTREPGLRTLSKIASALGTTLSELLKGL